MKRKRRLMLLVLNLLAAALTAGSAWLQWFGADWPAKTDFNTLLGSVNLGPASMWVFSVVMVILVAAALMLLAALTAWKIFGFLGAAVGTSVIVLWFINSNLNLDAGLFSVEKLGYGTVAMAAAIIITLAALFVPKRREKVR